MPPVTITVRTKLSRAAVFAALRRLPAACAGKGGAPAEVGALLTRVGLAFLEKAHAEFLVKARRGADDTGLSWRPLHWFTLRARHFGAALRRRRKAISKGFAGNEILIETAALVDSLEPGARPFDGAAPPVPPPKPRYQVFRPRRGSVAVGTSRPWAWTHHRGLPPKIPQRRLWPAPSNWTSAWWQGMLGALRLGAIGVAKRLLGAS